MKKVTLKRILYVFMIATLVVSCNSEKKGTSNPNALTDTITTASGLKYFYTIKGEGRKIEPGSKVSAQLSLKVKDSVVWTSYASKDSIFSHIAGRGGVIDGYDEVALLLREGDDVVAILPSDLAYGEKGSGKVIPPNSTLIYDRFRITYVSEPKLVLSDSLFGALKNGGIDKMKKMYMQIVTTNDSTKYHGGMDQLDGLWRKLSRANMFAEANDAFTFVNSFFNNATFDFYVIRSLENLGELKQAVKKIDEVLKRELPTDQKEYFINYKLELLRKIPMK